MGTLACVSHASMAHADTPDAPVAQAPEQVAQAPEQQVPWEELPWEATHTVPRPDTALWAPLNREESPRWVLAVGGMFQAPFSVQGAHAFDVGLELTLARVHFKPGFLFPTPTLHYGVSAQLSFTDYVSDTISHDLAYRGALLVHGGYMFGALHAGVFARSGCIDASASWGGVAALYLTLGVVSTGVQLETAFGEWGQASTLDTRLQFICTLKFPFWLSARRESTQ